MEFKECGTFVTVVHMIMLYISDEWTRRDMKPVARYDTVFPVWRTCLPLHVLYSTDRYMVNECIHALRRSFRHERRSPAAVYMSHAACMRMEHIAVSSLLVADEQLSDGNDRTSAAWLPALC
jgi:hypothetical protein